MKSYTKLQCFLTVFLSCYMNFGYSGEMLELHENEICRKGDRITANSICRNIENCPVVKEGFKQNTTQYQICSYDESTPIVCCPPEKNPVLKSYSAKEMCSTYSQLIYQTKMNVILNSSKKTKENGIKFEDFYDAYISTNATDVKPREFPHMALLGFPGYAEKQDIIWACGGSLISNRFILTAAHCEKMKRKNVPKFAIWARLGELDYLSETYISYRTDYKIVDRIIHPNYTSTSRYHDIALFRLERDVDFSPFVRPICLNTDNMLRPPAVIATGRGKIDIDYSWSSRFFKVKINTILAEECDESYSNMINRKKILTQGMVDDLMLCAGHPQSGNYTCIGMSGDPIQIKHNSFTSMYSQIGIKSFSGPICGENDSPTVYTRVSNYISWIERIVWPKV